MNEELPVEELEVATLKQAVFWIAFNIPPMPKYHEMAHKIPERTNDFSCWPETEDRKQKLEIAKYQLYFKLAEGLVPARGVRCAPGGVSLSPFIEIETHEDFNNILQIKNFYLTKYYDSPETPEAFSSPYEEIHPSLWDYNMLSWDNGEMLFKSPTNENALSWDKEIWGQDDILGYGKIQIDTKKLMEAFPKNEEKLDSKTKFTSNAGRPRKYNYGDFYKELACYIARKGAAPQNQSDVVRYMGNWCGKTWPDPPSETTLKNKIKPVFDVWLEATSKNRQ